MCITTERTQNNYYSSGVIISQKVGAQQMRVLYVVILLIILLSVFIRSYAKTRDFFSPLCIFSILQAIRYLPGMLSYDRHMGVELNSENLFYTFLVECIVVICILLGYYSTPIRITKKTTSYNVRIFQVAVLGIVIGLATQLYFIYKVGGVSYILANTKGGFGNGNGYLSAISFMSVVGACILISLKKRKFIPLILIAACIYILPSLIQFKRSPVLECSLYLIFTYHYCVKKITFKSIFNLKTLATIAIVLVFITVIPQIRDTGSFTSLSENINIADLSVTDTINSFFEEMSYTARDTFIYSNYNYRNYYYGRTAINLLLSPVPSAIVKWKPPVDDGLYLYNFIRGYYILPPSKNLPLYNSYPFSTWGSMYANFGIVGVILSGFILGKIYRKAYCYLLGNETDPFACIVYFCIVYQLEFSSLSIVQTLTPIVFTYIFLRFLAGRKSELILEERG